MVHRVCRALLPSMWMPPLVRANEFSILLLYEKLVRFVRQTSTAMMSSFKFVQNMGNWSVKLMQISSEEMKYTLFCLWRCVSLFFTSLKSLVYFYLFYATHTVYILNFAPQSDEKVVIIIRPDQTRPYQTIPYQNIVSSHIWFCMFWFRWQTALVFNSFIRQLIMHIAYYNYLLTGIDRRYDREI